MFFFGKGKMCFLIKISSNGCVSKIFRKVHEHFLNDRFLKLDTACSKTILIGLEIDSELYKSDKPRRI